MDERVEMEVQGDLKSINLMLRQMEEGHFIHISDMETEEMPIDEREGSFHIIG
ncbi:MAG: acylphosphatase [Eisenbergiella sp.]